MSDVSAKPAAGTFWLSVLGVIGCFLVFVVILYVAYLPGRSAASETPFQLTAEEKTELDQLTPADRAARLTELRWSRGLPSPEDRRARLDEIHAKEAQALHSYSWIDRDKGVVRLPINRAIELMVAEQQRTRARN